MSGHELLLVMMMTGFFAGWLLGGALLMAHVIRRPSRHEVRARSRVDADMG